MRIVSNPCVGKAVLLQRNFTGESPDTAKQAGASHNF